MTTDHTQAQNVLDPQLLEILCCPETKQGVTLLDQAALEKLNAKIRTGEVQNKSGSVVKEPLGGGLIREDQTIAYPIREGIPIMLIDEGISVKGFL